MNLTNMVKIDDLEKFKKCVAFCDSDCPIGQIYDFFCHGAALAFQKMKEAEDQKTASTTEEKKETV